MPKPVVYVETTISSYLTSDPSRDLIVAANQQITHGWWPTATEQYDLVVSDAVLDEIGRGDPIMAAKRLALVESLPVLGPTEDVLKLDELYRRRLGLNGPARRDAIHLAYAAAYDVDYLGTWNCHHIANGDVIVRLTRLNAEIGRSTPLIVTPQVLAKIAPAEFDDELP